MQASRFNVQVPLPDRNEVFLMNTFSDAQLLVSPDVAALLDADFGRTIAVRRRGARHSRCAHRERVPCRKPRRGTRSLDQFFLTDFARTLNSCASPC